MKTKIAVILILIAEIFAALLICGVLISANEICGIKTTNTPSCLTSSLFIASVMLIIAAYTLWTKTTKIIWFSCLFLAFINLGIMCWGVVYYFGIHCDGPFQITPDSSLATLSTIVAAIIALSLLFLLSDIKHSIRITTTENAESQTSYSLPTIILMLIIFIPITLILMRACSGSVLGNCRMGAYYTAREQIQYAVTAYMADSNHSSQLPIISDNATFTLTNPNGTYYIINMSALLSWNNGMLRQVPDGVSQLPGPYDDNCDDGATGCRNTSHYIWGIDNKGTVVSKPVNVYTSNESQCNACSCQCDTCDGYQNVWP